MQQSQRWYPFLNKEGEYSLSKQYRLDTGLVVRWEREDGNKYAWFRNHIDFWVTTNKCSRQSFHEVVTGNRRKAYFDIDKAQSQEELDDAVEEICLVLLRLLPFLKKEDIYLFTSNKKEKFSAHLVIHGYCYSSGRQVKELFNQVCNELRPETRDLLDPGVYSINQCLRILGSSKPKQDRPKVHSRLVIQGEEVTYHYPHPDAYTMEILRRSLVGFISDCQLLPDIYEERERGDKEDLLPEDTKRVLAFCRRKMADFPFRRRESNGERILLSRVSPSECPSCQRTHENENPYITAKKVILVDGGETEDLEIFFHCRRGPYIYLGYLDEDKKDISSLVVIEEKKKKKKRRRREPKWEYTDESVEESIRFSKNVEEYIDFLNSY